MFIFIQNMGTFEWLVIIFLLFVFFRRSAARSLGKTVGSFQAGDREQKDSPRPSAPVFGGDLDDCYRMLDLQPGADIEQVRAAYKELVKVWHPDRFGSDEKLRERATQKLQQINAAYEKLCGGRDTHSQN